MIQYIKIKEITYPERQKVIDLMYGAKGVRLDVYCEDEKKTVYPIDIYCNVMYNINIT